MTGGEDTWSVRLAWLTKPPHGRGTLRGASRAFSALPVALAAVPSASGETNPAELLAAAHASGFAAALALYLDRQGASARELMVTATCVTSGSELERRLQRVEIAVHVREATGARIDLDPLLAEAARHYRSALGLSEEIELTFPRVDLDVA
jgi:organic hydroperoxide reductase OsmC/OhrA